MNYFSLKYFSEIKCFIIRILNGCFHLSSQIFNSLMAPNTCIYCHQICLNGTYCINIGFMDIDGVS